MFEKLILSDAYNYAFNAILLKYGYVNLSDDLKILGRNYLIDDGIRRVGEKNFNEMILHIYQMALLFDEFIVYDYSEEPQIFDDELRKNKLIATTLVKGSGNNVHKHRDYLYIEEYVKPIVKAAMLENPSFKTFNKNTANHILDTILYQGSEELYARYPGVEWIEWENLIIGKANDIQGLHELSATNECSLLSRDYDFTNTHAECTALSNYALIRISYESVISELPRINNAHEILKLRKSKKTEIKCFREVMTEFAYIVEKEGKDKAMQKIVCDMHKASIELAKGNPVSKVSHWAHKLLVPVSVVERLLSLPPIGLSVNVIAWFADNYLQYKENAKKWCEIIR